MKYFVIIGVGNFTHYLIKELKSRIKCKLCVIDKDENKLSEIKKIADEVIVADVTSSDFKDILEEIDIQSAHAVVINLGEHGVYETISLCLTLHEKNVKEIYVKVISEDQEKALKKIGIQKIVFPERDQARKLANSLIYEVFEDFFDVRGGVATAKIEAPKKLVGKTLGEENIRQRFDVYIVAVESKELQGDWKVQVNPGADYEVKENDILVVFGKEKNIQKFLQTYQE